MNQTIRERVSALLYETIKADIRPYSTYDFGRKKDENCLSVLVSYSKREEAFARVRADIPVGLVAFWGRSHYELYADELIVGMGESQFDIIRLARTASPRDNLTTEEIIRKLVEYDHTYGIDIINADTNGLTFKLLNEIADLQVLAEDLCQFCPEKVEVGGGLDLLVAQIKRRKMVALTWDIQSTL